MWSDYKKKEKEEEEKPGYLLGTGNKYGERVRSVFALGECIFRDGPYSPLPDMASGEKHLAVIPYSHAASRRKKKTDRWAGRQLIDG